MLPRRNRLAASRDIARTYQKGRSLRSGLFRLSYLPNRQSVPRVAVVTSRKLSTKAVRRNLLKRQVRGIVHDLLPRLAPSDIVIQLLPSVISQATVKQRDQARASVGSRLTYERLGQDLTTLLQKGGLVRPEVESSR